MERIQADFSFLQDHDVLAVLVFGSQVTGDTHACSDIDICIVAPDEDPVTVMRAVWRNIDTDGKGYDVHTFEEFGLKMKHQVMQQHETVWCRDTAQLEEYFYHVRKRWNDQAIARGIA